MKLEPKKIVTALQDLVKEYNFTPEEVYNVIKTWLKTAFRRDYLNKNRKVELEMIMDKDGWMKFYRVFHVVSDDEEIEDEEKQIHLKDAKKENGEIEEWEDLLVDITPETLEFSRIATQAAAQTIKQQIKNIEKERFYRTFVDSEWDILTGYVKYVQWEHVILDFNWNTVILPVEWQLRWKPYEIGDEEKVLLKEIRKQGWDIVLEITQSDPAYVEAIMKKYIPEIEQWIVQIKKIARIAWIKTKVLVFTDDERVDPVWVCVWEGWERISQILDELDGERVDVAEYVEDREKLIKNIFSPARLNKIEEDENMIYVYADESQKPLLFGKKAVNVKLASKLLWKRIVIK
jgi:N utilization substance protein A